MIPISSLNSRIFELKDFFKDFAWALGYGDIMRQSQGRLPYKNTIEGVYYGDTLFLAKKLKI